MSAPSRSAGQIAARLDRITVWALPFAFLFTIGLGFLFTFYDIFDINVILFPSLRIVVGRKTRLLCRTTSMRSSVAVR